MGFISPRKADPTSIDLIAPVASQGDRLKDLLGWLRTHQIGIPTVTVVPEGAEDDLISAVSESSDDFLLAPIRQSELHSRLERILGSQLLDPEPARRRLRREVGLTHTVKRSPYTWKTST